MLHNLKIPDIAQRDRFIRRVVASRLVLAVAGETGLARLPSRLAQGREVTMLWSSRPQAERWARVVAQNPRVKEIPLDALLGEVLPALTGLNRLVGTDWSDDPAEPEMEPSALGERLKLEIYDDFVLRVKLKREVWILENSSGPGLLVSSSGSGHLYLPCWSERHNAEQRIEGPWSDMLAVSIPLENFCTITLPWLAAREWLVGPNPWTGSPTLELSPGDVAARLDVAKAA